MKDKIRAKIVLFIVIGTTFVINIIPGNYAEKKIEGVYEYVAYYEIGPLAGTSTLNHKVKIEYKDKKYFLSWGFLKSEVQKVANGFIYRWEREDAFGSGIYIFYDGNQKLFGTFCFTDKSGENAGYTKGHFIE